MALVIVERKLDAPATEAQLRALSVDAKGCFELFEVTFLGSLVSNDGCRLTCLYDATDVDTVRSAQRTAGLPFERVYGAYVLGKSDVLAELGLTGS